MKYAIRIPANDNLERDTPELQTRSVGRPIQRRFVEYKGFRYQEKAKEPAPTEAAQRTIAGGRQARTETLAEVELLCRNSH